MPVEAAAFVADLNPLNPLSGESRTEGDDHLRLLKASLKATFPGLAGRMNRGAIKNGVYSVVPTDDTCFFAAQSATAFFLPALVEAGNGWECWIYAEVGQAHIVPEGPALINSVTSLFIPAGSVARILCTGTRYLAFISAFVGTTPNIGIENVIGLQDALDAKAALNSPIFIGTPIAPTAAVNVTGQQIATTHFVALRIAQDAPTKSGFGAVGNWPIVAEGAINAVFAGQATFANTAAIADSAGSANTAGTANYALSAGEAPPPAIHAGFAVPDGFTIQSMTVDTAGRVTALVVGPPGGGD